MCARFYLPSAGRFISADTIVPDPMNPQAYNRYSYVLNGPINYTDPSGHDGMWCNDPYEGNAGCYISSSHLLMDPSTLGFDESNTDSLVLEFYRNPYKFTGEAGVEYYAPGVSGAAEFVSSILGQGGIPDIPGVPMEGYRATFSIHDWDSDGIPECDRLIFTVSGTSGLDAIFQAEWETRTIGGRPFAVETFPLPGGANASVILEPVVSPGNTGPLTLVSNQVVVSSPLGAQTVTFPSGTYIEFQTSQTSESTIRTVGSFYYEGNLTGQVIYELNYNPSYYNRSPGPPVYRVP